MPTQTPAASTRPGIDESGPAPKLSWSGENGFDVGANLPWLAWGCDFGCGQGARDGAGVSQESARNTVAQALDRAAAAGMRTVRWWMFPGEPWQFETDDAGLPVGLEPDVYADIDAALDVGAFIDVRYVFNLFSAPSEIPEAWRTNEEGRSALIDVLADLFERYADRPQIVTWQLVNEPEWEIWNGAVEVEPLQELARMFADAVHEHSSAEASIGSANLEGLQFWSDVGLDYYTAHWYDPMDSGIACALCTSYSAVADEYGLNGPIVIGEYFAGAKVDADERLESFRQLGYAGAWAWSLLSDETADGMQIDDSAVSNFVSGESND